MVHGPLPSRAPYPVVLAQHDEPAGVQVRAAVQASSARRRESTLCCRLHPCTCEMQAADAEAVAAIYNEGIRGRNATFRTAEQTAADVEPWAGWPTGSRSSSPRTATRRSSAGRGRLLLRVQPYAGVGELAIYVTAGARGGGVGRALVDGLADGARARLLEAGGQGVPATTRRASRCCIAAATATSGCTCATAVSTSGSTLLLSGRSSSGTHGALGDDPQRGYRQFWVSGRRGPARPTTAWASSSGGRAP